MDHPTDQILEGTVWVGTRTSFLIDRNAMFQSLCPRRNHKT